MVERGSRHRRGDRRYGPAIGMFEYAQSRPFRSSVRQPESSHSFRATLPIPAILDAKIKSFASNQGVQATSVIDRQMHIPCYTTSSERHHIVWHKPDAALPVRRNIHPSVDAHIIWAHLRMQPSEVVFTIAEIRH